MIDDYGDIIDDYGDRNDVVSGAHFSFNCKETCG